MLLQKQDWNPPQFLLQLRTGGSYSSQGPQEEFPVDLSGLSFQMRTFPLTTSILQLQMPTHGKNTNWGPPIVLASIALRCSAGTKLLLAPCYRAAPPSGSIISPGPCDTDLSSPLTKPALETAAPSPSEVSAHQQSCLHAQRQQRQQRHMGAGEYHQPSWTSTSPRWPCSSLHHVYSSPNTVQRRWHRQPCPASHQAAPGQVCESPGSGADLPVQQPPTPALARPHTNVPLQ